ncbi:hypothetical protein GXW83_11420 [Streptacidiphilus sp. PB12-B1b]|uniref:hypothetical protein n=1 Tax=Streptacidiphilus sp. PB12-B1b TaxID=2705012 RepID=UPI0015FE35D0|nr:hypothetical protein [Streptacidiphilus sp. PB12-B1b]QMU76263.1 hypothetical protein GXW83_11420 [Streptacidiphilus sp. PB12-B1b]
MTRLTAPMLARATDFIWLTGRVLEQRRLAFLFAPAPATGTSAAGAAAAGVLAALDAYRSTDGGYAYGLEPDVRGPAGQPVALPTALRVLDQAGALDQATATRVCDWLASVTAPDGGVPAVLPSLRDYPRPPWLPVPNEPRGDLLATGPIVGLLRKNAVGHPWLERAVDFCRDAVQALDRTHPYEAQAALAFLEHAPDQAHAAEQTARLGSLVREQRLVLLDPDHPEQARPAPGYAPGEHHLPYDYAPTPQSPARAWFTDAELARGLDALAAAQEPDGGWPIRWAQWAPTTAVESRPGVTLEALLTLRAWDNAAPAD